MPRLSRNIAAMSMLLVSLGLVLGASIGVALVEIGIASDTSVLRRVAPFSAVVLLAITLALALFWFAKLFVRKDNRALVGQLGGPFITASAALFAAYIAFSSVQTQIDLQQQSLAQSRADRIAQRLSAVKEIREECEKLALRIPIELNAARARMAPRTVGDTIALYEVSLALLKPDVDHIAELLRKVIVGEKAERFVTVYLLTVMTLYTPVTMTVPIENRPETRTARTEQLWRFEAIRQLNAAIRENLLAVNRAGLAANESLMNEEQLLLERYRAMQPD